MSSSLRKRLAQAVMVAKSSEDITSLLQQDMEYQVAASEDQQHHTTGNAFEARPAASYSRLLPILNTLNDDTDAYCNHNEEKAAKLLGLVAEAQTIAEELERCPVLLAATRGANGFCRISSFGTPATRSKCSITFYEFTRLFFESFGSEKLESF